jgi:hypothetical protein
LRTTTNAICHADAREAEVGDVSSFGRLSTLEVPKLSFQLRFKLPKHSSIITPSVDMSIFKPNYDYMHNNLNSTCTRHRIRATKTSPGSELRLNELKVPPTLLQ